MKKITITLTVNDWNAMVDAMREDRAGLWESDNNLNMRKAMRRQMEATGEIDWEATDRFQKWTEAETGMSFLIEAEGCHCCHWLSDVIDNDGEASAFECWCDDVPDDDYCASCEGDTDVLNVIAEESVLEYLKELAPSWVFRGKREWVEEIEDTCDGCYACVSCLADGEDVQTLNADAVAYAVLVEKLGSGEFGRWSYDAARSLWSSNASPWIIVERRAEVGFYELTALVSDWVFLEVDTL